MDKKPNIKSIKPTLIEWGGQGTKPVAQNNMSDGRNAYNHITLPNNFKDGLDNNNTISKVAIINRGNDNLAPQKDLELGKRSITQKKIAEGLAELVAGKELVFVAKNKTENGELTDAQKMELEIANSFLAIGLQDSRQTIANGLTYFNLASMLIAQKPPRYNNATKTVASSPVRFNAKASEELRFSAAVMDTEGTISNEFHAYHNTWGFKGLDCNDEYILEEIRIIPIADYIKLSASGKLNKPTADDPFTLEPAYYVRNMKSKGSNLEAYISHVFHCGEGIFDNAYPLPSWKSNSSINDIQAEFEASCIRIDYLRNGLHIFAIVNVYSTAFKTTVANEEDESNQNNWAENLSVIQSLRKSYNSGKILVNPVQTTDVEKDGKIEIEEVKLTFPVEAVKFFNEESRSSILTAWGVMADLFSISKPEKNNLRSQAEFMQMGIILLQDKVRTKQAHMERGYDEILQYYGLNEVKSRIIPKDNNAYLVTIKEFAQKYMSFNEVREEILGKTPYTKEQIDVLAEENAKLAQSLKAQGVQVIDDADTQTDEETDALPENL